MINYSKVTYYEYVKKRNEMLNYYGRMVGRCNGVNCKKDCPLCIDNLCMDSERPEIAIKIVMDWQPPEPEVDWSKIEIDTPIYVSYDKTNWHPRYFAEYKDGYVYAWLDGRTSFSIRDSLGKETMVDWEYAKLATPSETAQDDNTETETEKPKDNAPITNRDKIMQMDDNELVKLLKCVGEHDGRCNNYAICSECKLDWLKEKAMKG